MKFFIFSLHYFLKIFKELKALIKPRDNKEKIRADWIFAKQKIVFRRHRTLSKCTSFQVQVQSKPTFPLNYNGLRSNVIPLGVGYHTQLPSQLIDRCTNRQLNMQYCTCTEVYANIAWKEKSVGILLPLQSEQVPVYLPSINLYALSKRTITFLTNICLLQVNSRITRKRCEICSKLTIKTPELRHRCRSDSFFVISVHILHLFLGFLLLTLSK